jgi:arsenate reductase
MITIYHNPKCSNSRAALEIIRAGGHIPRVVEYLKTPLSKDEIKALAEQIAVPVRQIVREKEPVYAELGLEGAEDDRLAEAVAEHPILLNRPIVVTDKGAKLCRPPEIVKNLL